MVKIAKEETTPFSTRMKKSVKKALEEYTNRTGISILKFIEDAVINELNARRNGKK